MKEISLERPTVIEEARVPGNEKNRLSRWRLTLFFSAAAGIISALSGLLLGAISYFGFFRNAKAVNQTGNLLIIAAFPLMMLAAHALDKINEIKSTWKTL
jgi:hypothetical protein